LKFQPSQTEVSFEVPEALLNLHSFPINAYDDRGLQEGSVGNGNQQIPGFLIGWVIVNDHIYRDFPLSMIEDILKAKSLSRGSMKLA
jgi:hypothetical protein